MRNNHVMRLLKLVFGVLGTFAVLYGAFSGFLDVRPWRMLFGGGQVRGKFFIVLGILALIFIFPYLFGSSIMNPPKEIDSEDKGNNLMGSYIAHDTSAQSYSNTMVGMLFGVVITGVCIVLSVFVQPRY